MVQFTDLTLKTLTEPGYHYDEKLPGFGVYIGKKVKTFICVRGGKRTKIGRYGRMSLSDARKEAIRYLYDTPPETTKITLSDAAFKYQNAIDLRPNTKRYYDQFLRKLKDKYPKAILQDLTPRMIAEATISPHMHQALAVFFKWCVGKALIEKSPMTSLKPPGKFNSRDRTLTPDELKRVWDASHKLSAYGSLIRLLILSGQRRGEISQATRDWYTTELFTIPASVSKNKQEHILPLSCTWVRLLMQLKPIRNWSKPKEKLNKLSGVTDWVVHDLRRTFATIHGQIGTPPHIIEALLGHSNPAHLGGIVGKIYNRHRYLDEQRLALENYERHLVSIGLDL
jgi:integrase